MSLLGTKSGGQDPDPYNTPRTLIEQHINEAFSLLLLALNSTDIDFGNQKMKALAEMLGAAGNLVYSPRSSDKKSVTTFVPLVIRKL
jgi:hypothetical protein